MLWVIVQRTLGKFLDDNGPFLAAGLAFNLLLYCMPLSLLAVSALGYTLVNSEAALAWIQATAQQLVPGSQAEIFEALSAIISKRGLLGLSGFLLYVVLSTSLFAAVRFVLNRVFQVTQPRTLFRGVLVDFAMMLAVSAIVLLNVSIGMLLTLAQTAGQGLPVAEPVVTQGGRWGTYTLGVLFTAALFYVFYRYAPAATVSARALVLSSVTGTVLFEISKWAFALYVSLRGSSAGLYGALGGLVFFFIWLYYGSAVFVLGAEAGWTYDQFLKKKADRSAAVT
jgi:membrane protein